MGIQMNLVAEFTPAELATIIKKHLELEGYAVEGEIRFKTDRQCVGFYKDEHMENVFTGATVRIKPVEGK